MLLLAALPAAAQYHLGEVGGGLGGGGALPVPIGQVQPGYSWMLNGWYSRYICGKAYGYHIDGGLRGQSLTERSWVQPAFPGSFLMPGSTAHYLQLTAGGYFKLRLHNYHRKKELSFLLGPKVAVNLYQKTTFDGAEGPGQTVLTAPVASPGLHFSAWYRLPLGDNLSWFITPGFEYYFLSYKNTGSGASTGLATVFLQANFTFWSTR